VTDKASSPQDPKKDSRLSETAPVPVMQVGCAIIVAGPAFENQGKILIAQRKPGSFLAGYWEFPGGKCDEGESLEECLVREASEELGVRIRPSKFYCRVDHAYPHRTVSLHFYFCEWVSGRPSRRDCHDFAWAEPQELRRYRFVPADQDIINDLIRKRSWYFSARPRGAAESWLP
jgi:8-oxo-dGTP diphosphatase